MKEGYLYDSKLKCPNCKALLYLYHTDLGGRIEVCRSCNVKGFQLLAQRANNVDFNEPDPTDAKTK